MSKIIHILPHNIEDFISGNYDNFDHHSVRFINKIKYFSLKVGESVDQELWVLSRKIKTVSEIKHQNGFIVKFFPISLNLPLPLEISWSIIKAVFLYKEKNTIWHLHSYYLFLNDILGVIIFLKKYNFVIHHRGGGPSWTPKAALYTLYHYLFGLRIVLNLASKVFVQNKDEIKRLTSLVWNNKNKIVYFPNTVSEDFLIDLEKRSLIVKKEIKIIIAGRVMKLLNNRELIDLLVDFSRDHNLNITIVGCLENEKNILKKYFGDNNLTIKGWLSKNKLANEMLSGFVFFHTNIKENFEGSPSALIEAQACGLPSLGFDIAGVKDVIKDGYNGYLFKDIKDVAGRLAEVFNKKETLASMRNNCFRTVRDNFLDENYFPELIDIYKTLFKKI